MVQQGSIEALNLYNKMSAHLSNHDYYYKRNVDAAYYPDEKKIRMDIYYNKAERDLGNGLEGAWYTKFHEEFHQLDHMLGTDDLWFTNPSRESGKKMLEAIEFDVLNILNMTIEYHNNNYGETVSFLRDFTAISKTIEDIFEEYFEDNYGTPYQKATIIFLTDVVGLVTESDINPYDMDFWGHKISYNCQYGKVGATSETWAHFGASLFCGNKNTLTNFQTLMPETWNTYSEIFKEVLAYAMENDIGYNKEN